MKILLQKKAFEEIYILSVILAFGLLFYANAEAQEAPDGSVVNLGIGKSFYLPCTTALISSLGLKKRRDSIEIALYLLIIFAIISSIIHPPMSSKILEWNITRFIFAILCFKGLRNINPLLFVKWLTLISPIIVLPHYFLSNPFGYGEWRYGGFYGDANFLAIALNFIIVVCYLSYKVHSGKLLRACALVSVLSSIPLILVGMSRGGIIGLVIVLFFIAYDTFRNQRKLFVISLIAIIVFISPLLLQFGDIFLLIESRFEKGTANARIEGIISAYNVLTNLPELIPFGIGPGNTYPMMDYYRPYGYICQYNIHNTFVSILFEMGLFAVIEYTMLYFYTFVHLYKSRMYMLIGLLASSALGLFTLPGSAFMPGWILLFFLSNHQIKLLK